MSGITVYVPCDASAVSLGADEVASAIQAEADKAQTAIKIIRNGSRGLFWLEPMVEVATPQGRIAYGPARATSRACSRPASCRAPSTRCASASRKRSPISRTRSA